MGIYVQLFKVVALRMTKFTVVYLPIFLGFALCFRVTFDKNGATFATPLSSGIKALAMMSGELDYNSVLGHHKPVLPVRGTVGLRVSIDGSLKTQSKGISERSPNTYIEQLQISRLEEKLERFRRVPLKI
nr:uncharacterized protein LOC113809196 [Penaeus vannamei]